jgi:hypothetical protein
MTVPAASTASAQDGQPYAPMPAGVTPSAGGAPVINLQQTADPMPIGGATSMAGAMPMAGGGMPASMGAPAPATAAAARTPHHHHGLLGRRHCVECQRAHAKAADGVDIPPPPGYPGAPGMAAGETIVSGPMVVSERVVGPGEPNAPGYAVVGGPEGAAGYAVVNGGMPAAEPTPIGVARGGLNAQFDPRMAAAMPRPGAGSYDPSVKMTSVPPAPSPMNGPGHNRPHIISHVFGLPILGKHHEERVEKRREHHAAEAYGDSNEKVTDLPASMVYGRR